MWINNQACPQPNCGSSDAFGYNTESLGGYCFSCGESYPKQGVKYSEETLSRYPTKGTASMPSFDDPSPTYNNPSQANYKFHAFRGVTADTMEFYGTKTLMTASGDPIRQEYVYPSGGRKIRTLPKKFSAIDLKQTELFGMNLFPAGSSSVVTITEGELDAMSVWQMVNKSTKSVTPVVSLPSGSPSGAFWENVKPWLNNFKKIVLSVDADDVGDAVAEKINNMFPGRVYRVFHGDFKDANDFLVAGKVAEFRNAWYNANLWQPDNVFHTEEDFLKLFDDTPDHSYVPTGIQGFDDKALGLMQGHFTLFKAPTGIGKTELMRYLEWNFIQRQVPFATWHLEETKLRSILGLVSYDLNDNLTRKDLVEEKGMVDAVRASISKIANGGMLYQYYLKEEGGADQLMDQIRFFTAAYGCKFVLFEPIQDVINIGSEESRESALATLAVSLSRLAADLNVGIVSIAHTNDDGEVKYCRMLGQRASVIVRLHRDKSAEDYVEKNTTDLYIEKNRPTSEEGYAGSMLFDPQKFTMREKT